MAYNPNTATPQEKWAFRMRELTEFLDGIPFTKTQRLMIDHHHQELATLFEDLRIDYEDECARKGLENEISL